MLRLPTSDQLALVCLLSGSTGLPKYASLNTARVFGAIGRCRGVLGALFDQLAPDERETAVNAWEYARHGQTKHTIRKGGAK
jgi:acyl-CoA synthetase (AMP-forming)/AMP-acid ligase II